MASLIDVLTSYRLQVLLSRSRWLFGGALIGVITILWLNSGPSVILEAPVPFELDGIAQRGGFIDVAISYDRIKDCPAETTRLLWRDRPLSGKIYKQFIPLGTTNATIAGAGEHNVILSIPLPNGIEPDRWHYTSTTTEHCSWFPRLAKLLPFLSGTSISRLPDVPVQIIAIVGAAPDASKFAAGRPSTVTQ